MASTVTKKIAGYEKPTIWYKFSKLAIQTASANLGQGFPDWKAPDFYYESLQRNISAENANHQYTRSFGNLKLVDSIARNYKDAFKRNIDPLNEVLVSSGASSILYSAITALVDENDEVVVIEPFYECYLPQTQFSKGKVRGVPMIAPKFRNKLELKFNLDENSYFTNNQESKNYESHFKDDWKIDFELLAKTVNEKTKLLILNTPNNPTGKILTQEELDEIIKIVEKYPNLYILMDEVYEHQVFDKYHILPRSQKLFNKTISIMSAGKIFSATGVRVGWAIGPEYLIKQINAIHQYNSFCIYDPLQNTIADCLDAANKPYKGASNYYEYIRMHFMNKRNHLLNEVIKTNYFRNSNFFIPEGGFFAVCDISQEKEHTISKNYGFEEDNLTKDKNFIFNYTKDFTFLLNMAIDRKVVGVPLTPFFTDENKHIGENFVRLAFCKQTKTLNTALERLSI